MRVTRRRVTWIVVGGVLGLAGCINRDENENEDENGTTGSNDPTENGSKEEDERNVNENEEDATGGTSPERVEEVSFEVFEIESGTGEESASVSCENDRVLVRGTIRGENSCYTARIADVSLSDDELTIAVESYEDADKDQMCAQALVEIEYEARVEFTDAEPGTVVVEHDGTPVTTEER